MALLTFHHFKDVEKENWPWLNFGPEEMASKDTGALEIETRLLDLLQALRYQLDRPLVITSGYRTPEYNARVSGTGRTGPHTKGVAVDIKVSGEDVYPLVKAGLGLGFTGIGLKQHGAVGSRFVHLDILTGYPRPNIWTYE